MEETKKCPKCNNEMEEGITKTEGAYAGGTKWGKKDSLSAFSGNVKDGKDIIVYRCKSCGYLESYAK